MPLEGSGPNLPFVLPTFGLMQPTLLPSFWSITFKAVELYKAGPYVPSETSAALPEPNSAVEYVALSKFTPSAALIDAFMPDNV